MSSPVSAIAAIQPYRLRPIHRLFRLFAVRLHRPARNKCISLVQPLVRSHQIIGSTGQ